MVYGLLRLFSAILHCIRYFVFGTICIIGYFRAVLRFFGYFGNVEQFELNLGYLTLFEGCSYANFNFLVIFVLFLAMCAILCYFLAYMSFLDYFSLFAPFG